MKQKKFTGRVPPGPEYSYLRFQSIQFDPKIRRLGSKALQGGSIKMDPEVAKVVGLGRRAWTEEEAALHELGPQHAVCSMCGGRGIENWGRTSTEKTLRCRGCQGTGVVKKK